jgi:F-box interacting protein
MWNPSIRKFKKLPAFQQVSSRVDMKHGFGYDHVSDNYKVVIVLQYYVDDLHGRVSLVDKTEVKVHSFGTDFWKNVQEFPFGGVPIEYSGKFVSGTINWLVIHLDKKNPYFIVSFDLGNESYQKILLPDYGEVDIYKLFLSVLRDCLCMTFNDDVWIMKEYGHTESWIKLFTFSYMQDPNDSYIFTKPIYMFEDDQMLLVTNGDTHKKLIVYDPMILISLLILMSRLFLT